MMMIKLLHKAALPLTPKMKTRTHHEEGVADPQAAPARRTLWDGDILAVDCDGDRWSFAY